jgi:hypothetical protein
MTRCGFILSELMILSSEVKLTMPAGYKGRVSPLKTDSCGKQESKILAGRFTVFKKFRILNLATLFRRLCPGYTPLGFDRRREILRILKQTYELPNLLVRQHASPGRHSRVPDAVLYYPEELRICVLRHSFRKLWRWRIKRLSINTRLALRRAMAPHAHCFVGIYSGLQIIFVEGDWIRFSRRVPNDRSVKHRGHDPASRREWLPSALTGIRPSLVTTRPVNNSNANVRTAPSRIFFTSFS